VQPSRFILAVIAATLWSASDASALDVEVKTEATTVSWSLPDQFEWKEIARIDAPKKDPDGSVRLREVVLASRSGLIVGCSITQEVSLESNDPKLVEAELRRQLAKTDHEMAVTAYRTVGTGAALTHEFTVDGKLIGEVNGTGIHRVQSAPGALGEHVVVSVFRRASSVDSSYATLLDIVGNARVERRKSQIFLLSVIGGVFALVAIVVVVLRLRPRREPITTSIHAHRAARRP